MRNPLAALSRGSRNRRRDFSSNQRAANPFFGPGPRERGGRWAALLVLIGILTGIIYSAITPRYRVTAVKVEGTVKLNAPSIEQFVNQQLDHGLLGVAWRRVTYLTPTKRIEQNLRREIERLVSLESLAIERQGTNALLVTVKERTPSILWKSTFGGTYIVDDRGVLIERLAEGVPPTLVAITDSNKLAATVGTLVIRPQYLVSLKTIRDRLIEMRLAPNAFATWPVSCPAARPEPKSVPPAEQDTNGNRSTNSDAGFTEIGSNQNLNRERDESEGEPCDVVSLAVNDPTLIVATDEGWDIRFDTSGDLNQQLTKLATTLTELGPSKRPSLTYIDVRFGDRVFYQ